jgi:hypothetical protein
MRRWEIILATLLLALSFSGVAQTAAALYACVDQQGNIKITTASATCGKNETKIQWNQSGPPGPQGPPGSGTAVRVLDANGARFGTVLMATVDAARVLISLPGFPKPITIDVDATGFQANVFSRIVRQYESSDCSGIPLYDADRPEIDALKFAREPYAHDDANLYLWPVGGVERTIRSLLLNGDTCRVIDPTLHFVSDVLPAVSKASLGVTPPFRLVP